MFLSIAHSIYMRLSASHLCSRNALACAAVMQGRQRKKTMLLEQLVEHLQVIFIDRDDSCILHALTDSHMRLVQQLDRCNLGSSQLLADLSSEMLFLEVIRYS